MGKTLKAIRWMLTRPSGSDCTSKVYKEGPDGPEGGEVDLEGDDKGYDEESK